MLIVIWRVYTYVYLNVESCGTHFCRYPGPLQLLDDLSYDYKYHRLNYVNQLAVGVDRLTEGGAVVCVEERRLH